ncbi:hypothetical protein [Paraclostridium bifermentans]|nr:hypothetical protein [Paraclostridium bifermentans]UOW66853.1 hypothetical protein MTR78_09850 [Paraclostridium bifermentans]
MANILKRMMESNKYTYEYIKERIDTFYLVGDLTKEEFIELNSLNESR